MEDDHLQRRSVDLHRTSVHPPPMEEVDMHQGPFDRIRIGVPGIGNDRCSADIGYSVAAECWGQGIATQAVKTAVTEVFDDFPHILRIQAFVDVENKASQWALEKAGFLKEAHLRKYTYLKGNLKDLFLYSFLSTDRIPPPPPPPPAAAAAAAEEEEDP